MALNYIEMNHICADCRLQHPDMSCEEVVGAGECEVMRAEGVERLCALEPKG